MTGEENVLFSAAKDALETDGKAAVTETGAVRIWAGMSAVIWKVLLPAAVPETPTSWRRRLAASRREGACEVGAWSATNFSGWMCEAVRVIFASGVFASMLKAALSRMLTASLLTLLVFARDDSAMGNKDRRAALISRSVWLGAKLGAIDAVLLALFPPRFSLLVDI